MKKNDVEFKDSEIIDNIINAEDIDPDSHDGSYELVRETVKSLSKIDKNNLDIKDLNLLYGMAIGSWKLNFKAKSKRIYESNLSDYEKSRLDNMLKEIEDNAKNDNYSNKMDGKYTVGMFGTGFFVFDNNSTKEDANKFLNLCINIKDIENEEEIFNLAESKFKDGIAGIQSSSASIMLHCLKPTVFPILTRAYIEKLPILKRVGLILEETYLLTSYIKNSRKLKEFRDKKCNFKNYRVLDIELLDFKDSNIKKKENLNDFLQIEKNELIKYKIKLNTENPSGTEPIDVMLKDDEARHSWMGWRYTNNDLSRDYVIGLAREYKLGQDFWRFIGVFEIMERHKNVTNGIGYRLKELKKYDEFKNTLLLKYKNNAKNLYRNAETLIEQLKVIEEPIGDTNIGSEGLEAIVDAFKKRGGQGRVKDIFDTVKNDSRFNIDTSYNDSNAEDIIEIAIREHSSDSSIYKRTNKDLFNRVDNIDKGLWKLRLVINNEKVDFLLPIELDSLYFEDIETLKKQISTSLESGKSIILIGPPGTGKSKLAKCIAKSLNVDSKMVTAMSDWSSYDTIGGYKPNKDGSLYFEGGIFLNSLKGKLGHNKNQWLIIDEINRADIDKAFGPFLSALSGDNIELGLKDSENRNIKLILEKNLELDTEVFENEYIIPKDWRIIGTMNTFDKTSLYEMSYAFMRRFAFIPVPIPRNIDEVVVRDLCELWEIQLKDEDYKDISVLWKLINKYRKVGPAIIEDIARFIKLGGDYTSSIIMYILPQLEGIFDERIVSFVEELKGLFTTSELEKLKISVEDFFNMKLSGK